MDRIEKALEKTLEEQLISNLSPNQSSDEEQIKDIIFSETKTLEINPRIMAERLVLARQKHNPISDLFRLLRTKILKQLNSNNWNSFAITAPTQDAGKTMVSVNLAIAIAMEVNQTVLLVDMDLRRPKIHWYFDFNVEKGLYDYIVSDIPLSDVLVHPGIERLVVLPGRGEPSGPSELLSAPKMKHLVDDIKNRYKSRIVIFDLPPVLSVDDVLICMDYFDAALLVVEDGAHKPEEITKSLQMLSGTQLLGMVMNKATNPPVHQGYY